MAERLVKAREMADILGVHMNTVLRWSNAGWLPYIRISARGDRRYSIPEVIAAMRAKTDEWEQETEERQKQREQAAQARMAKHS